MSRGRPGALWLGRAGPRGGALALLAGAAVLLAGWAGRGGLLASPAAAAQVAAAPSGAQGVTAPAGAAAISPFGAGPCGALLRSALLAPADSLAALGDVYAACVEARGDAAERAWLDSDRQLVRDVLAMRRAGQRADSLRAASGGARTAAGAAQPAGAGLLAQARRVEGRYGAGPGRYDCVTWLLAVLGRAGYALDEPITAYVKVDFPRYRELFDRGDPRVKGVVTALAASGQGREVADTRALQPGDVVQYWYWKGGRLLGHAGIIAAARGGGRYDLLGAHRSRGRVGVLRDVDLAPGGKAAVYAVRPLAAPAGG